MRTFLKGVKRPGGKTVEVEFYESSLRLLDLGVVRIQDLLLGPVTLFEPDENELVGPVLIHRMSDIGNVAIGVFSDDLFSPHAFASSTEGAIDSFGQAAAGHGLSANTGVLSDETEAVATTSRPLLAALASTSESVRPAIRWTPNTEKGTGYEGSSGIYEQLVEDGNSWSAFFRDPDIPKGSTGLTKPDFSSVENNVTDGDITWTAGYDLSEDLGWAHFLAYAAKPHSVDRS